MQSDRVREVGHAKRSREREVRTLHPSRACSQAFGSVICVTFAASSARQVRYSRVSNSTWW